MDNERLSIKVSNILQKKKDQGFTLIEIVLVLAIAGLILLMVFLAVSGAQKSRRDTQRKQDLSRLAAQVESYASNNDGLYPSPGLTGASWGAGGTYTPSNFNDPSSGTNYFTVGYVTGATPATTAGSIAYQIGTGTTCDGVANTNARVYTLRMQLEQGIACVDNK